MKLSTAQLKEYSTEELSLCSSPRDVQCEIGTRALEIDCEGV